MSKTNTTVEMKRVYIASNLPDAHLVCQRLEVAGIPARVFNEFSNGAVGDLPFTHTWPEVWVKNDSQADKAQRLVQEIEAQPVDDSEKMCPSCEQMNPSGFEICWNCSSNL